MSFSPSIQIPSYVVHREESGLSSICWSPVRPAVFAASTLDGVLLVYDLRSAAVAAAAASSSASGGGGAGEPARALRASENYRPKTASSSSGARAPALTSTAFAAASTSMVAAGDALGRAHVWKLDSEVAAARPSEIKLLERFITAEAEE